jgi:hypothetical protein
MLRAPVKGIDYSLPVPLWRRPRILILFGATALNGVAAFFCTISFLVADTRAQALAERQISLPPTWEVGVWNHGSYYEWYSIAQHPLLFGMSLAWLVASSAAMSYVERRIREGATK